METLVPLQILLGVVWWFTPELPWWLALSPAEVFAVLVVIGTAMDV